MSLQRAHESWIVDLLLRIKARDWQARERLFDSLVRSRNFENLIIGVKRRLRRTRRGACWIDPLDIAQNAICAAWESFGRFRGRTRGEFYAWIWAILRNEVRRALRSGSVVPGSDRDVEDIDPCADMETPLDRLIAAEQREALDAAVQALPESQRRVVEMRLRRLTTAEICRELGLKTETVYKRECRARARLRALLSGRGSRSAVPSEGRTGIYRAGKETGGSPGSDGESEKLQ